MKKNACLSLIAMAVWLMIIGGVEILAPLVNSEPVYAAEEAPSPEKIQWFRDNLQISEKYKVQKQGIMGMSWGHFLTMVFLVIFFIGASAIAYHRSKRSREILEAVMKEREKAAANAKEG